MRLHSRLGNYGSNPMASADRDGRMAQWMSDMHATLSMELHKSLIVSREEFDRINGELNRPPVVVNPLLRMIRRVRGAE